MERGRFKRYQHDHYFYEMDDRTVLNDKIRFSMPLGPWGDWWVSLCWYRTSARRLRRRLVLLRKVAENRTRSGRNTCRRERVAISASSGTEFLGDIPSIYLHSSRQIQTITGTGCDASQLEC